MKVDQCHISSGVRFFGKGFKKKWDLKDYYSSTKPCIFLGCYQTSDVTKIKEHKGLKIVLFTGSDHVNIQQFVLEDEVFVISDTMICRDYFKDLRNIKGSKFLRIPLKDYSSFTSVSTGKKIYAYQGKPLRSFQSHYRKDLLDVVVRYFGEENVIIGYQGHDIEFVKENYYKQSFVNLQLTPTPGLITSIEMAHMGRRSISNYPAPYCIPFETREDVIKLIERERDSAESTKAVAQLARNFMFQGEDWLDTKFWEYEH